MESLKYVLNLREVGEEMQNIRLFLFHKAKFIINENCWVLYDLR